MGQLLDCYLTTGVIFILEFLPAKKNIQKCKDIAEYIGAALSPI